MKTLLTLALLSFAPTANAQDDSKAGLFATARQLPMIHQALAVTIEGDEASVILQQTFLNNGGDLGQADLRLPLPPQATVDGFSFWSGGDRFDSELKAADDAAADHAAAASAGHRTGLLQRDEGVHHFSIYPVLAGAQQRVEVRLTIPLDVSGGERSLTLDLDDLIDDPRRHASVSVMISADHDIESWSVTGENPVVLVEEPSYVQLAFDASNEVTISYRQDQPELLVEAVAVAMGPLGIGLRVNTGWFEDYDYEAWPVTLVVDGSTSMARYQGKVGQIAELIAERTELPVTVESTYGHQTDASHLDWRLATGAEYRIGVADAQLTGLGLMDHSMLVFADESEAHFFEQELESHYVINEHTGPGALTKLVDSMLLPALEVEELEADGRSLVASLEGERSVPLGSTMAHSYLVDEVPSVVFASLSLDGVPVEVPAEVVWLDENSAAGKTAQRQIARAFLKSAIKTYRRQPSEDLKRQIIEVSLFSGIATPFTSLHVSDPSLSLMSIKPGDPIVSLKATPGITDVWVSYPFGQTRQMSLDNGVYTDRFLVPRGWTDGPYRVDLFSKMVDGSVVRTDVWYLLDDATPSLSVQKEGGLLVVSGDRSQELSTAQLQLADGTVILGERVDGDLKTTFAFDQIEGTLLVRDRAGNLKHLVIEQGVGQLIVLDPLRDRAPHQIQAEVVSVNLQNTHLSAVGDQLCASTDGLTRCAPRPATLRGLNVTASGQLDGDWLFGTQTGDLLVFTKEGEITYNERFAKHPVTGIATDDDGEVFVGVLGQGLWTYDGGLSRVPVRLGSRFVTGLAFVGGELYVGTKYNGLWRRKVNGRWARTGLEGKIVLELEDIDGQVIATTPFARYQVQGRRAYLVDDGRNQLDSASPDLMAAVYFDGELWTGGLDTGLATHREGESLASGLPLSVGERRVNDLVVVDDLLWVASEAGVYTVSRQREVTRITEVAAVDLAVGDGGVAMATKVGVWFWSQGVFERLDAPGGRRGAFTSVAYHQGQWFAGHLDGLDLLHRDWIEPVTSAAGFDGLWVTSMASNGEELLIGTYASGVYRLRDQRAELVPGLEHHWVGPGAISAAGGTFYVGHLGGPMAEVRGESVRHLSVPVSDVNGVLPAEDGLWLVTSDGLVFVEK